MKKLTIALIIITLLVPKQSKAQSNGAAAAAAVGVGLLAIGAGIAAVEDMKERAELTATQWVLANHPELNSFSLKTLDFNGKKTKDMSATSVISFKIQEFSPSDNPKLDGRKQVLLAFTSYGWISDQGIDFNKVQWYLIDSDEWLNMMVAYAKVASKEKSDAVLKDVLNNGVVVNKGIKAKGKSEIPFFKLEGDMYLVTDYSSEMKLIYNEKTLGIFLKKTENLVQMGRAAVIDTHEFLFQNN
ncbi:hypothetical protein [Flavobacterium soyangense]|uniref:Uncharacterized protein n=1 Tax=Flavobacterium soyangense TaxID=2023265 RepID=A0A930UE51_9FLAO|nr:hypothetical protein [Flavobacterium soyangense]MBF2709094.1 hypothetical protein [Flavobacterium soyangense]